MATSDKSKTGSKIGKTYPPLVGNVHISPIRLTSQDISNWRVSIDSARNHRNPLRRQLIELLINVELDGHLSAVMDKRITNILNSRMLWVPKDPEGQVSDVIIEQILQQPWFNDLLRYAMEQVAWGHSLMEMIPDKTGAGLLERIELIPRFNVRPEFGFVMYDYLNVNEGVYYKGDKADPLYSRTLLEIGGPRDYGKLMKAAQYVIYKRGGFGDWAQFAELFGMPFRVGKYNPYDEVTRNKLTTALENMGGAGFAVIPDGTSLEFLKADSSSGGSSVYKDLLEMCNAEISKIFLGQTMTTDNGSSRSQSEVHKEVEEDITASDMMRIEYFLNSVFKPKLMDITGLKDLENGSFHFDKSTALSLDKAILIDQALVQMGLPVGMDYLYQKYGVTKPNEGDETVTGPANTTPPPPGDQKKA